MFNNSKCICRKNIKSNNLLKQLFLTCMLKESHLFWIDIKPIHDLNNLSNNVLNKTKNTKI